MSKNRTATVETVAAPSKASKAKKDKKAVATKVVEASVKKVEAKKVEAKVEKTVEKKVETDINLAALETFTVPYKGREYNLKVRRPVGMSDANLRYRLISKVWTLVYVKGLNPDLVEKELEGWHPTTRGAQAALPKWMQKPEKAEEPVKETVKAKETGKSKVVEATKVNTPKKGGKTAHIAAAAAASA